MNIKGLENGWSLHTHFLLAPMIPSCLPRSAPSAQILAKDVVGARRWIDEKSLPSCFKGSKDQFIRSGLACIDNLKIKIMFLRWSL